MKNLDKFRGCLIGGAAGDALGYVVEFLDESAIFRQYGMNGITEYSIVDGVAQISDDTQMTLFTANGLLLGTTRGMTRGIMGSYPSYISLCYKDWLRTQYENYSPDIKDKYTWLMNIPELFQRRAPGNTCLSAIQNGANGTIEKPINTSKGCGGIMRVAPIGLYFEGKNFAISEIDRIGAEVAALTHGHELGYIPAAALVHMIQKVAHHEDMTLLQAVLEMKEAISKEFANAKHLKRQINLIDRAIALSCEEMEDVDAIRMLGQGWVAEETLAIAIYCSLKYSNDFDKAMIASVNHSGDSDSTGAVTGNILGAYLGLKGIPKKYLDHLELKDVILEMADDLFYDCQIKEFGSYSDKTWEEKYISMNYKPVHKEESMDISSNIILFPDFQQLKDDVERLRSELSMMLLERDELQFVVCKNIETKYMLKLGSLEYKAYEAQCSAYRLKRKLELIQARKNRQEKVDISKIEEILDIEFKEYQEELDNQINQMNKALLRSKANRLSEEDSKELKKFYRKIMKTLHPDINTKVTEALLRLYDNALTAYKNGDLNSLKIIYEMVGEPILPEINQDAMSQLTKEKERLEDMLKEIKEKIELIQSKYPYSMKEILKDSKKTAQKKTELENILSQYEEMVKVYKVRIEEMLR